MQMKLARDVTGKKGFCNYLGSKRKTTENFCPLLNKAFFGSVVFLFFFSMVCFQASLVPVPHGGICGVSLTREEDVLRLHTHVLGTREDMFKQQGMVEGAQQCY